MLFPALSLLLVAYTNRFLVTAGRIRALCEKYRAAPDEAILPQIRNLRERIMLIRGMQYCGVASLLSCVGSMLAQFAGAAHLGLFAFGSSLVLLIASLAIALREIQISVIALNVELRTVVP